MPNSTRESETVKDFEAHRLTNTRSVPSPPGFSTDVVAEAYGSQVLSAYSIALEAWRRGLTVRFESADGVKYQISDGKNSVRFNGSRSVRTTRAAIKIVDDKFETITHLNAVGAPTPGSRVIETSHMDIESLHKIVAQDYGWPVVLKPVIGSRGDGVFANITTPEELESCYQELVSRHSAKRILLESHISGYDYRVYVVGDTVAGACKRIPANVSGNGVDTVEVLIQTKNELRKQNPFLSKGLIKYDFEIKDMLSRQGLTLDSIPSNGTYVQLRQKANASAGGDVEDVTETLPQHIKDAARASVRAIPGLEAAGVDIVYDPSRDDSLDHYAVIELNARAHIGVNMYPTKGDGQDVPRVIVDHFFPQSQQQSSELAKNIALPFRDLLYPIKTGVANRIEATPAPDHMYSCRKIYEFEQLAKLSIQQKRGLIRAARLLGVAGSLSLKDEPTHLIASGDEEGVRQFLERAVRIVKFRQSSERAWTGPVMSGFRIT